MYWFLLLFPLMIYPWGYDPIFTTPKYFYLQMFVFLSWLFIIIRRKYQSIELDKSKFRIEILVAIFIGFICLSTVFSVNQMTSIYGTENRSEGLFTFVAYCSIFLFSYRFLNEKEMSKIIPGVVMVSIFISIYGILQHYQLDFLPRSSGRIGYERSYAFFGNPNFFGSYLVIMMMLAASLYLTAKNKKTALFYLFAFGTGFVALIFSGTRSGWVGVFCALLFVSIVVIIKRRYLWKKWAGLLMVLVFLSVAINVFENESMLTRMNSVMKDAYKVASQQSTGYEGSSRLFIWEESLPLIKEYFWIGSGPDTFKYVFPATPEEREQYLGNRNMIVDKAHNEYLQIAITIGVPALILYMILTLVVLTKAFQAAKVAPEREKILLYGLVSAIFGYLVQAFFNISVVSVAPYYWAILGVTLALSAKQLQKREAFPEGESQINKMNQSA